MASPSPRALVVDDDKSIRYTVRAILEHAGFLVDEAANGLEGLARLDEQDYAVVITDIQMPRMCGREMMEAIRLRPLPHPKIIVITSDDTQRTLVESLGPIAYFRKPFDVEEMIAVVRGLGDLPVVV